MLRYLVEYTFVGLSAERDYQDTVEFFKDKDTSKYSQALAQVLDSIRAKIAWVDVSSTVSFVSILKLRLFLALDWRPEGMAGEVGEVVRGSYLFCRVDVHNGQNFPPPFICSSASSVFLFLSVIPGPYGHI
jgi:hypothetical protein